MQKVTSWKTNITSIIFVLTMVALALLIWTESIFASYAFLLLLIGGFIMSAIGIFSKKEKKSFRLIAVFIIFGLAIFWISCVMYLGFNGFYDN